MTRKTVPFTKEGIAKLPENRPVNYDILTDGGRINYTGKSKRGQVQDRLLSHVEAGKIPGAKVRIHQKSSVGDAEKAEGRKIRTLKPKYNKKGK